MLYSIILLPKRSTVFSWLRLWVILFFLKTITIMNIFILITLRSQSSTSVSLLPWLLTKRNISLNFKKDQSASQRQLLRKISMLGTRLIERQSLPCKIRKNKRRSKVVYSDKILKVISHLVLMLYKGWRQRVLTLGYLMLLRQNEGKRLFYLFVYSIS